MVSEESKYRNGIYKCYHLCILITPQKDIYEPWVAAQYTVKILTCEFTVTLLGQTLPFRMRK